MARPVDLKGIKKRASEALERTVKRYERLSDTLDYPIVRWVAEMTAVEAHSVWERYAEQRLVAAINHYPQHFIDEYGVRGVTRISAGLAVYLARQGRRYFDFRSTSDLIARGDHLVSDARNPFRLLPQLHRQYLDALSAVRNCVVHRSEAATVAYKRQLKATYSIIAAPEVGEFLNAKDYRAASPARYKSRLHGLVAIVTQSLSDT